MRVVGSRNGVSLDWDERYRLKNVDDASSFVAYEYDVLNRRVSRIEGSTTNYFVYNGNQVVADLDGNGDLLRTYVWGTGIDNLLSFADLDAGNLLSIGGGAEWDGKEKGEEGGTRLRSFLSKLRRYTVRLQFDQ